MAIPKAFKVPKVAKSSAKSGMPMNPVTKMKMENGIPGMKKGGVAKKSGGKCK